METQHVSLVISDLDVHILTAPDESRPHWVSHFIVPRANEVLVRLRTNEGHEGFGLATSYTDVSPIVSVFHSGLAEQIIGMSPLAPERIHCKLLDLTATRLAHEKGWGREALVRICAAVDLACWDLIGKVAKLPLYQIFGGYRAQVPAT